MRKNTHRHTARAAARRAPASQVSETAMATRSKDTHSYFEFAKTAFAPAARFKALVARNVEQSARLQYALLGDWMQLTLEQLNAVAKVEDFGSLASHQAQIANRYAEVSSRRTQELLKVATDSQAEFARWVEDSIDETRKAA
jgi:phasin family protein